MHALLLAFWFAAQGPGPAVGRISGTVVNAATGVPLGKVQLFAEKIDGEKPPLAGTMTDARGNFVLVDLPAGKYTLTGERNGFLETQYGARRAGGSGIPIALDAGQEIKDLQVKLFPFGVIAGTVRDADGEPMAGAGVKLFRQVFEETGRRSIREEQQAVSDDLGQYRITNLEPGKYFVIAEPRNGTNAPEDHSSKSADPAPVLLPTLYPGVIDPSAARTVEVTSGARVLGVDIPMVRSRVFRVTVRATAAAGLEVNSVRLQSAGGLENLGLKMRGQKKAGGDEFEIQGVPPGSYILAANADARDAARHDPPGVFTIEFFRREYLARLPVTIAGDTENLRILVNTGSEVSGRVLVKAENSKPGNAVPGGSVAGTASSDDIGFSLERGDMDEGTVLFASRSGERDVRAAIKPDKTFATGLYPGQYQVYASSRKFVIQSIRANGADVFQDGITVASGDNPVVEIVLSAEGGQVDGVAVDSDDKPVAGATVLLVAEPKLRSRADSFLRAATDQYGRYHFENVRPGDYKVFAWEDLESQAWFDPELLKDVETKGEPVALEAGGRGTTRVRVLPPR